MEVNVKNSNNIISKVYKGSIAEEIGIEVGDLLIAVNDEEIHDIIEYRVRNTKKRWRSIYLRNRKGF